MSTNNRDWAEGFAKQAFSDLDAREALVTAKSIKCHRLHFLQMAVEKTCKAYLTTMNGHESVKNSHAYISRTLPTIARQFYAAINDNNQITHWEMAEIRRVSHEIQVLSPACNDGGAREDNSEYPWEDGQGKIHIPCEYNFPNIDDGSRLIIRLIRLIRTASESYFR